MRPSCNRNFERLSRLVFAVLLALAALIAAVGVGVIYAVICWATPIAFSPAALIVLAALAAVAMASAIVYGWRDDGNIE